MRETAREVAGSHIAGQWRAEGAAATSANPARPDEPVGTYAVADADLVEEAVAAARAAQPGWRARTPAERGRILRRAAELIAQRTEQLAELMTREEGKTLPESRGEIGRAVDTLHYHATRAWAPSSTGYDSSIPGEEVRTVRVPVGVVAAIAPWNFPLLIPVWKLAPALVHGNAVVWKPASATPLMAVELQRALVEAGLPEGVCNLVLGGGRIGAGLAAHHEVDAITFTGSTGVGRSLERDAIAAGKRIQVELGGHNPAIVFDDADLDQTVEALVAGVTSGTGQKCTATRRVLAHRSVRDELAERLAKRFGGLRVGDGLADGVNMGPLISDEARDEVLAEVRRAVDHEGAEIVTGGDVPEDAGPGAFLAPTVLAVADQQPTVCREEVFGPVTTLLAFDDDDEALALANDTPFGLTGAAFTRSERRTRRVVEELQAGMVNINTATTGSELHAPFGGMKGSSSQAPKEQGETARDFVTELKAVYHVPAD